MQSNCKDEDPKMDEASIVNVLREDLQDYKIKTQIRRKDSQIHVLITRDEGDDLDYAHLYDIVKSRIDKLSIEWADCLVMYGRLSGAKQAEWQKSVDIKPPLPLIELDLDELEDFSDIGEIANLTNPSDVDATEIQADNLGASISSELQSFESSIEEDLKQNLNTAKHITIDDFDLESLDLKELKSDNLNSNNFNNNGIELVPLELDNFELDELRNQAPKSQSNSDKNLWLEEDLNLEQTTVAMPMPLPPAMSMPLPPPLPPTSRAKANIADKADKADKIESTPEQEEVLDKKPRRNSLFLSIAFVTTAIAILGVCVWLLWERSAQQQHLANSRNIENQNLNPKKITKLDTLTETRNQLQTVVSQLEEIPDRPLSLYAEAQSEINTLRPKLEEFDRKINTEQEANKKLELAKNTTLDAAKLVLNPPHKSTVWKSALEKRQQALKMLEAVPPDSLLYPDAQNRIKAYRAESVQIGKWVEIQQKAESSVNAVSPDVVKQIKQLKPKYTEKQQFLPQCKTILQPQVSNAESQKTGLSTVVLTEYLCAYFWDS